MTPVAANASVAANTPVVANTPVAGPVGLAPTGAGDRIAAYADALVFAYLNAAVALLDDGDATRDDIDTAMRLGCGLPAGPLVTLDRIGLDDAVARLASLHRSTGEDAFAPAAGLVRRVGAGRLGRRSGRGFYRYGLHGAVLYDDHPRAAEAPAPATHDATGEVRHVGVVGSGTMAQGIAETFARAGYATLLLARSTAGADSARQAVEHSLARAVFRRRLPASAQAAAQSRLTYTTELPRLADRDLIVEAVVERIDVKRQVFAALGGICRPGAVLATTTSSLSVAECTAPAGRPSDVLGLHFFNPAPLMPLVELVTLEGTGRRAVELAHRVCAALGKTAVTSPDRAGFIVNYLLFPYLGRAIRLLERADVTVEGLDAAVVDRFGFPMGPFTLLDAVGLDVSLAIQDRLHEVYRRPEFAAPARLRQMVGQGCLGRKNGRGFRSA